MTTDERAALLNAAADDCIDLANYLLNDAPNMVVSKERRYRATAAESQARATALRALIGDIERMAAEVASWKAVAHDHSERLKRIDEKRRERLAQLIPPASHEPADDVGDGK